MKTKWADCCAPIIRLPITTLGESEGAMYDRVSGALFRNAGTGAFAFGPDK